MLRGLTRGSPERCGSCLTASYAGYAHHVDYIHWNPVKHGHVLHVADWPHSSYHRHVARGVYPLDWGGGGLIDIAAGE